MKIGPLMGTAGFHYMELILTLTSGMILENSSVITISDEFADIFRSKSDLQNGTGISGLDNITNEELVQYLTDDSSSIIFHSDWT